METLQQLCQEMAQNPHVMSFRDIKQAMLRGAVVGNELGIPGGFVGGAALGLATEAAIRVEAMIGEVFQPRPSIN